MEVVSSKNVFINSETGKGDGQNLALLFPPDAFSTNHKDELMRLTLTSFTMRRNFYSINKHNNVFYHGDTVGTVNSTTTKYTIPIGDYSHAGFQIPLNYCFLNGDKNGTNVATITCALDGPHEVTHGNGSRVIELTDVPTDVTDAVFWSDPTLDTHEILGGTPDELFVVDSTTSTTFHNKFPYQLDSISDVYLRTNLQSNNFISKKENNHLGNTDIFARIPLYQGDSTLSDTKVVKWEDNNDLYSIYIPNHQLSNVVFHLTDDKMRSLPMSDAQAQAHNINFKLTFKFEILRRKETASPPPLPYIQNQMDYIDLRNDTSRFRR